MQSEADQIIRKALQKEQYWQVLLLIALLCGSALLSYHYFNDNAIMTLTGSVLFLVALRYLYPMLRTFNQHRLLRILAFHPEEIVWVYPMLVQRRPFGIQLFQNATLYLKLANREEFTISLTEKEIAVVMNALRQQLPHSSFGYSGDKAQWYLVDPELLRQ